MTGRLLARKQSLALLLSLKSLEVNGVWNPVTIISDDQSIDGKVDNGIISLSSGDYRRLFIGFKDELILEEGKTQQNSSAKSSNLILRTKRSQTLIVS